MIWLFAVLIVLAMGGVALLAAGKGRPLAEEYGDRPDALVPAEGPVQSDDLRRIRFSLAFRGYRMSEVDALLDRMADQLEQAKPEAKARDEAKAGETEKPTDDAKPDVKGKDDAKTGDDAQADESEKPEDDAKTGHDAKADETGKPEDDAKPDEKGKDATTPEAGPKDPAEAPAVGPTDDEHADTSAADGTGTGS